MIETAIASETIGIEQQGSNILGAALSLKAGAPWVDLLFEVELPRNVKPLYTDPAIQKLCQVAGSRLFIVTIPGERVIQRRMELPLTKEKDILAVLPFESESLIPFPTEDAVIDKITLDKSSESTKIQLYAAKKDDVRVILELWNSYHLDPEWICPEPLALVAFSDAIKLSETSCFIIHLSLDKTTTCLIYGTTLLGTATSLPFTSENSDAANQELLRVLLSLCKQNPDLPPSKIAFVGMLASKFAHADSIASTMQLQNAPPEGLGLSKEALAAYALPIGSALLGLPNYRHLRINLRKDELAYPAPLKRYMKPIALYLGLCTTLSLFLVLFGKTYISREQNELRSQYVDFLAKTGRDYDALEEKFASNQIGFVDDPAELTMEDLNQRLDSLDKDIKNAPKLFPLQPNTPQVSDVLAWISSHPVVEANNLKLETFSYTLIKRPDLKKMNEVYRVKVEVEFSAPTPKAAREFHDALLEANDFVDPKEEVKWSSNRGKYRAIFFLKDKTNYKH